MTSSSGDRWKSYRLGVNHHPGRPDGDSKLNIPSSSLIGGDEFRPFYEFSEQLFCILAADTKFHRANPAFEDILGLPQHDLSSCSIVDFIHSEDVPTVLEEFKKLGTGQSRLTFTARFRCRGGVYKLLHWTLYPDSGRRQLYGIARDVTEERLLRRRVEQLETKDPVTGAATRAAFEEAIQQEWRRMRRLGLPIAVALVEFDHVDRYIASVGRTGYEECIKRLAQNVLSTHARRAGDMIARYEDATFAVIWSNVDGSTAEELAEQVRADVERMRVGQHGTTADGRMTVSVGLCSVTPTGGRDPMALVKAAAAALDAAENQGRNRVVTSMLRQAPEWERVGSHVQPPDVGHN